MYVYMFVICLFAFLEYLTAGSLTLCLSSIQGSCFVQQPVVDPGTRRFCRAFIASVSVRVCRGWVLRCCAWVQVLMYYQYLTSICRCFSVLVLLVCVCVFVSRCVPADCFSYFGDKLFPSALTTMLLYKFRNNTAWVSFPSPALNALRGVYVCVYFCYLFVCFSEYTWQPMACFS
jgi:hypothetical protein